MSALQPRYPMEEFARRGDEIYDREIHPNLTAQDEGKFVLIDIETGAYEIDADEIAASDRLFARHPDAQVWMTLAGSRYARRFGPRHVALSIVKGSDALAGDHGRVGRCSGSAGESS
jgi:hypothetical protein